MLLYFNSKDSLFRQYKKTIKDLKNEGLNLDRKYDTLLECLNSFNTILQEDNDLDDLESLVDLLEVFKELLNLIKDNKKNLDLLIKQFNHIFPSNFSRSTNISKQIKSKICKYNKKATEFQEQLIKSSIKYDDFIMQYIKMSLPVIKSSENNLAIMGVASSAKTQKDDFNLEENLETINNEIDDVYINKEYNYDDFENIDSSDKHEDFEIDEKPDEYNEIETETEAEAEVEADTEIETETETDIDTEIENEDETEIENEIKNEDSKTEVDNNSCEDNETNVSDDSDKSENSKIDEKSDENIEIEAKADTETEAETETETETETVAENETETEIENKIKNEDSKTEVDNNSCEDNETNVSDDSDESENEDEIETESKDEDEAENESEVEDKSEVENDFERPSPKITLDLLNSNQEYPTLVISEKHQKVYLPFLKSDLDEKIKNNKNYKSYQDVINAEYTLPMSRFKNHKIARFQEAYNLMKKKENASLLESLDLALEVSFNNSVYPAVITACDSLDELDFYLDCIEKRELDKFDKFKVVFEVAPL